MITIEAGTAEKLAVPITTVADPTSTPPQFNLATSDTPGAFVAGTWATTWNSTTGAATALTPLVGSGQALTVAAGTDYRLHVKWTAAGETPIKIAGIVRAI